MMPGKRYVLPVIAGLLILAGSACAQSTGAFARLGFGGRGMAMGNALVADGFGSTSAFYNPALAPMVTRQTIDAGFGLLAHDRALQHLQFSVPLRPMAGFTAGLIRAAVSDIDGRDASGYHTETYQTEEYGFFFDFGLRFSSRITAGVGVRFYRNDLLPTIDPANSLGLSLGLLIQPVDRLFLGVAADDLLAAYQWDTAPAFGEDGRKTTDRFPTRIRAGGALRLLDGSALLTIEVESLVDRAETVGQEVILVDLSPQTVSSTTRLDVQETRIRTGFEWWPVEILALRAGVDRIGSDAVDGLSPTFGFALTQDLGELGTQIDYALVREPFVLGFMHLVGIRLEL